MLDVLNYILESIGDFLSKGLRPLFDLIETFFSVVINLFSDFLSDRSGTFSSIGSHFISVFDSFSFNSNFLSFDFIYFFVGLLAVGFVFKLVWQLISNILRG